jgi:hypothetical protein
VDPDDVARTLHSVMIIELECHHNGMDSAHGGGSRRTFRVRAPQNEHAVALTERHRISEDEMEVDFFSPDLAASRRCRLHTPNSHPAKFQTFYTCICKDETITL